MKSTVERAARGNTVPYTTTVASVLLAACWALAGASCEQRPDPPAAVEVKVIVTQPCQVPEPQCRPPAYDGAVEAMPGDQKVRLLRSEAVTQEDCVRLYQEALASCRRKKD